MSAHLAALERAGLALTRALAVVGQRHRRQQHQRGKADGLARWLLSAPIEGVRDAGSLVIAVAIACLLPVGMAERSHITIRAAEPFVGARGARALDAAASVLVTAIMALMCWQFFVFAGKVAAAHETTWILKWPRAPFWYAVAAILALGVAVQVVATLADIRRAAAATPEA